MASLQFFSMKDTNANHLPSTDPRDVAIVDFNRAGKAHGTYLAAMLLSTEHGQGLAAHVFEITEMEIRRHFIQIAEGDARDLCERIYAYALCVFAWQPDGKIS